ncbi:hypothetical protein N7988_29280 (plasmid) [Bacillus cereus]|uniref:hypothetical protein n=1 Tax=Bacillus cereus group TaxID=86661 RepID=UPI00080F658E|nr:MULTISPECIES: hypothetical protein [Bacillus cereus group]ANV74139.1 hypothetical protein BCM43_27110 [Bacillus thuringiensis]MCU7756685.1 hypothetical protein [Bacillus cereus]MDC7752741.1 hypothetical protein [Bacillus cereus]UXP17175.1 hypothetical protein N7988_29280 [Bacillus cereus]
MNVNEIINLISGSDVSTAVMAIATWLVASSDFHFSIKLKDGKWEIEFSISRKKTKKEPLGGATPNGFSFIILSYFLFFVRAIVQISYWKTE